jgi:hypothetical protein
MMNKQLLTVGSIILVTMASALADTSPNDPGSMGNTGRPKEAQPPVTNQSSTQSSPDTTQAALQKAKELLDKILKPSH